MFAIFLILVIINDSPEVLSNKRILFVDDAKIVGSEMLQTIIQAVINSGITWNKGLGNWLFKIALTQN